MAVEEEVKVDDLKIKDWYSCQINKITHPKSENSSIKNILSCTSAWDRAGSSSVNLAVATSISLVVVVVFEDLAVMLFNVVL